MVDGLCDDAESNAVDGDELMLESDDHRSMLMTVEVPFVSRCCSMSSSIQNLPAIQLPLSYDDLSIQLNEVK